MGKLNAVQKSGVLVRIACIDGIEGRLSINITCYSQSSVGRDFKVWAQMAPFISAPYLTSEELKPWLSPSHVPTY